MDKITDTRDFLDTSVSPAPPEFNVVCGASRRNVAYRLFCPLAPALQINIEMRGCRGDAAISSIICIGYFVHLQYYMTSYQVCVTSCSMSGQRVLCLCVLVCLGRCVRDGRAPHVAEQLLSTYWPRLRRNNPTVPLQACFRSKPSVCHRSSSSFSLGFVQNLQNLCRTCCRTCRILSGSCRTCSFQKDQFL